MGSVPLESVLRNALAPRATLLFRLGLHEVPRDICELRRAYRALALRTHPDKCSHPEAKLAFQRISEAFDELSQPGALQKAAAQHKVSRRRASSVPTNLGAQFRATPDFHGQRPWSPSFDDHGEEDVDAMGQRGGRRCWWEVGWSEFEKRLRQREAEVQQAEALEAAALHGEDTLDAYMTVLLGQQQQQQQREQEQNPHRVEKRGRVSMESCSSGRLPFRSVAAEAPPASDAASQRSPASHENVSRLRLKLANGCAVSVAATACRDQRNDQAADVLADLDSEASELSD